jgi:Dyp-type peroxidase family
MTDQAIRQQTRQNVQAHILRASKFEVGGQQVTRNWSLFFFFRILPQAEFDATKARMKSALAEGTDESKIELLKAFAHPALLNAGLLDQRLAESKAPGAPPSEPDAPAEAFLNWLKAITSADKSGFESIAGLMPNEPGAANVPSGQPAAASTASVQGAEQANVDIEDPVEWIQRQFESGKVDLDLLRRLIGIFTRPDDFAAKLQALSAKAGPEVPQGPLGPLPTVTLCEMLRQCAPAMTKSADAGKPASGIVRGESDSDADGTTPINIAFTYSGLAALKIDEGTLRSFPDPFRQGMAARAGLLHDTGPSAPQFWEGELGLPSVHGYFTGGFALGDSNSASEAFWKAMRRDVRAFNDPVDKRGQMLRFGCRMLFWLFGLEILHIELGQDPYEVSKDGEVQTLEHRYEHFGFRDGLSQPFVDMGLRDTLPGGGTPSRDRTWSPVAPGEIFLNLKDEGGEVQLVPVNGDLTVGSTFLVFRKLEQDVGGFRAFLSRKRKDPAAQEALAAQIVGRWRNGVPLVLSPDQQRGVDPEMEAALNDFRYAADDPLGRKCPLGAHIRRANPRDIGGRGEARHHRILRRGISYGGPLLKEGVLNDGEKRGLLFIAANSRIDLQFEVIQSNWINGSEFLGQAGLGRCPLIGDHSGDASDSFLEAGAAAPVTGLPRFVTTRGGDYFFAPGIDALRKMANGERFKPDAKIPFAGYSMGDAKSPVLLDPDRLQGYGARILHGAPAIHISMPSPAGQSERICFIGHYQDVKTVLRNPTTSAGKLAFSVRQYTQNGQRITRGGDLVVGTEAVGPTAPARKRLHSILFRAWVTLGKARGANPAPAEVDKVLGDFVRELAGSACTAALRRTAFERRIDLVNDLATQATLAVITELYGIPAPDWLTEIAVSLRFAHQHIGELPPEWLATLIDQKPDNPGQLTLQVWSCLLLADLIGNVQANQMLHVLAGQAGAEMLAYIDTVRAVVSTTPVSLRPKTLLTAFIENEQLPRQEGTPHVQDLYESDGDDWRSHYYRDVSALLLEIVGTSLATTPLTFGAVMESLLKLRLDLPTLVRQPVPDVLSHIIYEAERLNPNLGIRVRYCATAPDQPLPSGAVIDAGEWVVSLIGAANKDPQVFPEPFRFKLDRDIKNYLLFNESGDTEDPNPRACWGRDRIAMIIMKECVMAASRLQGLRKVAGKGGELVKLLNVTVGLPARFTQVTEQASQAL